MTTCKNAFTSRGLTITVQRLDSGYYHLRGQGPCNWAQPPTWPVAPPEDLDQFFFPEAGSPFRAAVYAENLRLLEEAGFYGPA